jgi:hypothetical protein
MQSQNSRSLHRLIGVSQTIMSRPGIVFLLLGVACIGCRHNPPHALDHAALWRASKPAAYTFEYRKECFCELTGIWWRVEVRGNRVVAAAPVSPGDSAHADSVKSLDEHPTIDDMFQRLAQLRSVRPAKLDVRFDSVLHFPAFIDADEAAEVADDEWRIAIRNVTPLVPRGGGAG